MKNITVLGIDLAKNVFQLHGTDSKGKITLKKYSLVGSSHNDENIVKHLEGMITYWRTKMDDILGNYTDLINIRDELVGDAEQMKYLLTFK